MRITTIAATVAALSLGLGAHAQDGDHPVNKKAADKAKRTLAEKQTHARAMIGKLAEQRTQELRHVDKRFAEAREQVTREFKGRAKEIEKRLAELGRKHHTELAAIDRHFFASRAKALKPLAGDDLRKLGEKWDHERVRLQKEVHDKIAQVQANGETTRVAKIEEEYKKRLAKLDHDFKAHKRHLFDAIEKKLTGSITVTKRPGHRKGHDKDHGKGNGKAHGDADGSDHGAGHDKANRKEHRAP